MSLIAAHSTVELEATRNLERSFGQNSCNLVSKQTVRSCHYDLAETDRNKSMVLHLKAQTPNYMNIGWDLWLYS